MKDGSAGIEDKFNGFSITDYNSCNTGWNLIKGLDVHEQPINGDTESAKSSGSSRESEKHMDMLRSSGIRLQVGNIESEISHSSGFKSMPITKGMVIFVWRKALPLFTLAVLLTWATVEACGL